MIIFLRSIFIQNPDQFFPSCLDGFTDCRRIVLGDIYQVFGFSFRYQFE
jgi:hypothetical protein